MRFWDASAVVPLLVTEPTTAAMKRLAEADPEMSVWWGTRVECVSALRMSERAGRLDSRGLIAALELLDTFAMRWSEVPPSDGVRWVARRALLVHALRAADSLQLAAALSIAGERGAGPEMVCLDTRLTEAATREGLRVVGA